LISSIGKKDNTIIGPGYNTPKPGGSYGVPILERDTHWKFAKDYLNVNTVRNLKYRVLFRGPIRYRIFVNNIMQRNATDMSSYGVNVASIGPAPRHPPAIYGAQRPEEDGRGGLVTNIKICGRSHTHRTPGECFWDLAGTQDPNK